MTWRENIPTHLKPFIERLIKETSSNSSFRLSKNPAKAQLWLALGILAKQTYDLELKTKFLEQALKEISPKAKTHNMLKAEAEVEKFISEIAGGKYKKGKKSKKISKKARKGKKKRKPAVRTNF